MNMEIGLRILKSKRALLGLTQIKVAKMLGMTEKSYNMKENGKSLFSLQQVIKVSEILDLTLQEVNEAFLQLESKNN